MVAYSMPIGAATPTHPEPWEPRQRDTKRYLHFDRHISVAEIIALTNNPKAVASNSFYPLLRFKEEWVKFRVDSKRKKKIRPLRYSSRRDAAIYARYRALLSEKYEQKLRELGIQEVPIAYRKIPNRGISGNKSNIDFARDIFENIRKIGNCVVTVVDIKSYFESLDHRLIRERWEEILGSSLPEDHEAIFRALTKYTFVDREAVYERLGLYEKVKSGTRKMQRKAVIDVLRSHGYKQICSPKEFRDRICGRDPNYPSLIQRNPKNYGIPQGTPISDLIANFYLLHFDLLIAKYAEDEGGVYRRYSDDIILVMPYSDGDDPLRDKNLLQAEISNYGSELQIQNRKVTVARFVATKSRIIFSHVYGDRVRNGLEYLGFEYNGKLVKIKNSTLSNAWRKLKRYSYGHAKYFVRRYREKGETWLRSNYPFSDVELHMLRDVTVGQDTGFDTWTFIKYTRRASRAFSSFDRIFSKQTRRYRYKPASIALECFERALERHGK
ncbi:MAG: hypothetical protein M9939_17570 [Mesorhizobium sp.]|nr:hypothetical protein [Mesorhizobium sp.]MCO5162948.1 hypothetical protein [Mesorhizobium sp.]